MFETGAEGREQARGGERGIRRGEPQGHSEMSTTFNMSRSYKDALQKRTPIKISSSDGIVNTRSRRPEGMLVSLARTD